MRPQESMKAWLLRDYDRPLEWVDLEVPAPGPGEILLKVKSCGLCYTDLKIMRGEIPPPIVTLPHILGHEVAGEVAALGENVTGIEVGDVGAVYSYIPCLKCARCLAGNENLCPDLRRVGFERSGGFAEYIRIPAYNFCPLSRQLPLERMAILGDAIGTPYRAITRLAKVRAGQDVLIVGAGGLGIHAVQIARLCGARVIVVDRDSRALDLARRYGARETLTPEEAPASLRDLTAGRGVDAVIEIVGSPDTLSWSLPALRSGGTLVLVGYAPGKPFPLDTMAMHYNEYRILGSRYVTKGEMLELIKLLERGQVEPVVTRSFPFEEANQALQALAEKTFLGRTILTLSRESSSRRSANVRA